MDYLFTRGPRWPWIARLNFLTSNFSFSHSVFKRLVLQTHKNQGLFGKGLTLSPNAKILASTKLKAFAEDKFNVA